MGVEDEIRKFLFQLLHVDELWCFLEDSNLGWCNESLTLYQSYTRSHAMNNVKDIGREGAQKDCCSQQCADSTPEKQKRNPDFIFSTSIYTIYY